MVQKERYDTFTSYYITEPFEHQKKQIWMGKRNQARAKKSETVVSLNEFCH